MFSPECTHSDETCTAYLGGRGGDPYLAKTDAQLILVYANAREGNLQKYGDAALPNIQTADLNGENRRTICQFSASDNLLPGLACDSRFLYCVLVRMDGTSQENVIVRVALASGEVSELCRLPAGTCYLMGAEQDVLTVVNYPIPEGAQEGELYATKAAVFLSIDRETGKTVSQKEFAYTPNTATACFLVEGARLYVYSPFEDAVTVEDLRTGQELLRKDEALGRAVESCQLLGAAQGRVILDVFFADAPQTEQMFWVDCATGETQAFAQQGEYSGPVERTYPIVPLSQCGEEFVTVRQYQMDVQVVESPAGGTQEVGELVPVYAFIPTESYWCGEAAYEPIPYGGGA